MPKWVVLCSGVFFVIWFLFISIFFATSLTNFIHKDDNKVLNEFDYTQLNRVDFFSGNGDLTFKEEIIISDKNMVDDLQSIFQNIKWKKGLDVARSKQSDALVSLFFSDKNVEPERIVNYFVWFDEVKGKTILQSDEETSIGYLNAKDEKRFKKILLGSQSMK